MARTEITPKENKRTRSVGVRMTPAQYDWLQREAKRLSERLGIQVTMSAIACRIIGEAMKQDA